MKTGSDRYVTEFSSDGERYVLPRRDLGAGRHFGWIICGFGVFVTLFMCVWMYMPITEGIRMLAQQEWFGIAFLGFGLLGLIGLIPGVGMLVAGLAILSNRSYCVVSVQDGKVYSTERVLFLRWRRKCVVDSITKLRVADSSELDDEQGNRNRKLGALGYAIAAERRSEKDFIIAPGYPKELLTQLCEDLAPRMEAELISTSDAPYRSEQVRRDNVKQPQQIQVTDDKKPEVPQQPNDSDTTIERREDGVIIRLPPRGIWRGSKGLVFFALVWNVFILIFTGALISSFFGGVEIEGNTSPWFMLLFLTPFIAVGVGLVIAIINMGKRHAIIATSYNSLFISHHSIFGKKVREWPSEKLDEIRVGPSGTEINDRPVMELQVFPHGENKFGLLSERSDEELHWVAGELNQSLQLVRSSHDVPVPKAERDVTGDVILPQGSSIVLSRSMHGLEILVPPVGIFRHIGAILLGSLFAAVGLGVTIGVVWSNLSDGFQGRDIMIILFISLWTTMFTGAGLAVLCTGLVAARRRFEIRIREDQLIVDRTGPFGKRQFVWDFDDLEDVLVTQSDIKVNNRSLPQVQVVPKDDKAFGMLTDRSGGELSAVAAILRDEIGIQPDVDSSKE